MQNVEERESVHIHKISASLLNQMLAAVITMTSFLEYVDLQLSNPFYFSLRIRKYPSNHLDKQHF
jgi:hypothetical protein